MSEAVDGASQEIRDADVSIVRRRAALEPLRPLGSRGTRRQGACEGRRRRAMRDDLGMIGGTMDPTQGSPNKCSECNPGVNPMCNRPPLPPPFRPTSVAFARFAEEGRRGSRGRASRTGREIKGREFSESSEREAALAGACEAWKPAATTS